MCLGVYECVLIAFFFTGGVNGLRALLDLFYLAGYHAIGSTALPPSTENSGILVSEPQYCTTSAHD